MLKEVDLRWKAESQAQIQIQDWQKQFVFGRKTICLRLFHNSIGESSKPNLSAIFGQKLCAAFMTVTEQLKIRSKNSIQKQ